MHFEFPSEALNEIRKKKLNIHSILCVDKIVPKSSSFGILKPGDWIFTLENELICDDLYLFDKIIDKSVGKSINISIYRYGKLIELKIDVLNAEETKIKKFVLFDNVYHDLTPDLRKKYEIYGNGTVKYFDTSYEFQNNISYLIEEVNGTLTPNLGEFVKVMNQIIEEKRRFYTIIYKNLTNSQETLNMIVKLNPNPLKIFLLKGLIWEEQKNNQKEKSKKKKKISDSK